MALPADILARLPEKLRQNGLISTASGCLSSFEAVSAASTSAALQTPDSSGAHEKGQHESLALFWQLALREGMLPNGAITELTLSAGAGGIAFALNACRHKQAGSWVAFVDPSGSLHAPGVLHAGLDLERLLVVRPSLPSLARTTLRLAESRLFRLVVVDLVGTPSRPLDVRLNRWVAVVRRLSRAIEGTERSVLLLSDADSPRAVPLPVTHRLRLACHGEGQASFRVERSSKGRLTSWQMLGRTRKPSTLVEVPRHRSEEQ